MGECAPPPVPQAHADALLCHELHDLPARHTRMQTTNGKLELHVPRGGVRPEAAPRLLPVPHVHPDLPHRHHVGQY
ncbi:hypothetical protein FOCC_FOCC017271 [Frankliniella occidentalis]|nr:hypothetical protein FOCC_FOCC017271 [Frankliniella occidentalis]